MGELKPGAHVVKVTFTARWVDYVEVTVPDGVTEADAEKALDAAIDAMDMTGNLDDTDIETESVEWETEPTYAPPDPTVPDAAWIEIDGARWATNGHVAIREGCPLPDPAAKVGALDFADWMIPQEPNSAFPHQITRERVANSLRKWIAGDTGKPSRRRFSPIYAPILRAGSVTADAFDDTVIVRNEAGEPIAIVRPIFESSAVKGVRADGVARG